jgi:hypothetical protein
MFNQHTTVETANGRKDNQEQESPVPPAIEDITGHYNQQVLPFALLEHKPVKHEHYRQKHQELKRIKVHILC